MTAQIREVLFYRGEQHAMCAEPLAQYFVIDGVVARLRRDLANSRRPAVHDRAVRDVQRRVSYSLETIFPEFPERVYAHWFSGELRLPRGELLKYVHMGYGSRYEEDLFLEVSRGVVTRSWTRRNGVAPPSRDESP
jgi:hypothetical protein